MALGDSDFAGPLARARRAMRETPEAGWAAVEARVITAVRETARGGWPFAVVDPDPSVAPGAIVVTDLALKAVLANDLRDDSDYAVGAIDVVVREMAVQAVRVELTGRYGVDLRVAAQRALAQCGRLLDEVVGAATSVPIEVVITDVYR